MARKIPNKKKNTDLDKFFYSNSGGTKQTTSGIVPEQNITIDDLSIENNTDPINYYGNTSNSALYYGGATTTLAPTNTYYYTNDTNLFGSSIGGIGSSTLNYFPSYTPSQSFTSVIEEEFSSARVSMSKDRFIQFLKRKVCSAGSKNVENLYKNFIKSNYSEYSHCI